MDSNTDSKIDSGEEVKDMTAQTDNNVDNTAAAGASDKDAAAGKESAEHNVDSDSTSNYRAGSSETSDNNDNSSSTDGTGEQTAPADEADGLKIKHSAHGLEDVAAHPASMESLKASNYANIVVPADANSMPVGQGGTLSPQSGSVVTSGDNKSHRGLKYHSAEELAQFKSPGEIMRHYRLEAGYTIAEVANLTKLRATTISHIENNQLDNEASAQFVMVSLAKYTRLLNIDGAYVSRLYWERVNDSVEIKHISSKSSGFDRRLGRMGLIVVLFILVATAGYFVFGSDNSGRDNGTSGSLNAGNESMEQELSSGSSEPLVTAGQKTTFGEQNTTVINEEGDASAPEVIVVDENTAKAAAQAQALEREAAQAEANARNGAAAPDALLLPKDNYVRIDHAAAPEIQKNTMIEGSQHQAAKTTVTKESGKGQDATAQSRPTTKDKTMTAASDKSPAHTQAAADKAAAARAEAEKEQDVALAASLKNLSAQAKVVNREGLGSLNSAEIRFSGTAALKVIDSSKKVLKSGVFHKGDKVQVTGMPPITVQLSDTSAATVHYNGGTVSVPKSSQVQFELPMR